MRLDVHRENNQLATALLKLDEYLEKLPDSFRLTREYKDTQALIGRYAKNFDTGLKGIANFAPKFNNLGSMTNIPEAKTEIIENYKDIKDLIKKVKNYVESTFLKKGFYVINQETNYKIEFNNNGIGKLFSGKLGETKLLAYTAFEDIIKYATLSKREPDRQGRADVIEIIYFDSRVIVNENEYYFGFNVWHTKAGKYVYSAVLPTV